MLKITMPAPVDADGNPLRNRKGEPVPRFTGRRAGLHFVDGKYIDDEKNLGDLSAGQRFNFERWGYTIEGDEPAEESDITKRAGGRKGGTAPKGDADA